MTDRQRVILKLVRSSREWEAEYFRDGDADDRVRASALWFAAEGLALDLFGRELDKTGCPKWLKW